MPTTKYAYPVRRAWLLLFALGLVVSVTKIVAHGDPPDNPRPLAPLPKLSNQPDAKQVALGRLLFFDNRLSGDSSTSCATCHDPKKGWTDGLPLSKGYPGSLYFRNTPTVLNAAHGRFMYWDGRLPASDLPTLVRDHISEAHFMQADGRLVIEQLRQVPEYEQGFKDAFGGEPTYGRILKAVAGYVMTLRSRDVPFDRFLQGDTRAISAAAKRGIELFRGQAGCIQCHDGPMLSDGRFHNLGLPPNRETFRTPERSITFRRFFKTLGVSEYERLRTDLGRYAVTKQTADRGRFRTPSLREVSHTAPYMHDGSLASLEDVIEFYNQGGGSGASKDPLLHPLYLAPSEKQDLITFLGTLSGAAINEQNVKPPEYKPRELGKN